MKTYKTAIKWRIFVLFVFFTLFLAAGIACNAAILNVTDNAGFANGLVDGFRLGISIGIAFVCLVWAIRYIIALKNDTNLQRCYNCENDERKKLIKAKCGGPVVIITAAITILAAVIIGQTNTDIFIALVCAAILQLLVSSAVKFYYTIKL